MAHDGPGEHYHDIGERVVAADDTVEWTTVGLDIGSSTSQLAFSRIRLARFDAFYLVVGRELLHQSNVLLTPYVSPDVIDQGKLAAFVASEFSAAGIDRADIDAGAVIMTGLALSTTNARAIAEIIADDSGRFVAVSAGDALEARLAASGAGVPALSARTPGTLLHMDIGGGTTKITLWRAGDLIGLAAIDVGARLVRLDANRRIQYVEAPAARIARELQLDLQTGAFLEHADARRIARELVRCALLHSGLARADRCDAAMLRTAPLFAEDAPPRIDAVVFSGGVSEYIYGRERRQFGDLGQLLGEEMRVAVESLDIPLLESERGIRATVLGASQHTVQLSGNTIFVSDPDKLPLRNVLVILASVDLQDEAPDPAALRTAFGTALALHIDNSQTRTPAIAFTWQGSPTFARLEAVAGALQLALAPHLGADTPCIVIVDGDVAGLLGEHLHDRYEGRRPVICVDGVHVREFDHVDIGAFGPQVRALPIVVKSLLFADNLKQTKQPHARH